MATEHPRPPAVTPHATLTLVQQLAREIQRQQMTVPDIELTTDLDRQLGFDSLARAELLQRAEKAFELSLPPELITSIDTPQDLYHALCLATSQAPVPMTGAPLQPAGQVSLPRQARTLQEVLIWHATHHPERPHLQVYTTAEHYETVSYGQLHDQARRMAAGLAAYGIKAGQPVAIMLPTCSDYFYVFYGILLLGAIPVPIYPPARASQLEDHLLRHRHILDNAGVSLLVTLAQAKSLAVLLKMHLPSLRHVLTTGELKQRETDLPALAAKAEDIALLQYTSGSTGQPKGVILSHRNLLSNVRAMGSAIAARPTDIFVSWLPIYHDMGLIGACLGSLYHAIPLVIMSPLLFLTQPRQWLWAIHHHRGTLSAAPNFAYELCLNKLEDEDLAGLDLSCWRLAWNGAEPVNPGTLSRFAERFGRYGLSSSALSPVYGLAECSVGLTFPPMGRSPVIDTIDRRQLTHFGKAIACPAETSDAMHNVALGFPLAGHQIRVVDDAQRELPERQEGEVQFQGPSATRGYYQSQTATRALFSGDWLVTGDRGYLANGELYLTGRSKDIIIRAGRNIYPHELETAISELPGIRKGGVAVVAVANSRDGTEQLVILAEYRQTPADAPAPETINELSLRLIGTLPDQIHFVAPRQLPKTSSGKIRRRQCAELYQQGLLDRQTRAPWLQIIRLMAAAIPARLGHTWQAAKQLAFAGYQWLWMLLLAPTVWLMVVVLPSRRLCWRIARSGARLLAWVTATRVHIEHRERLEQLQSGILVVNHASYLDGLLLMIALKTPCRFVAKAELRNNPFARLFLSRLDTQFVERFDPQQSLADARRLEKLAKNGSPLCYFPEGTFHRAPGLGRFHLGAFIAAVNAGQPVVPITLLGSRDKLRGDSLFPRTGDVTLIIGEPVAPPGRDWRAALLLRDEVRSEILSHCREPDLVQRSHEPM